MIKSKNASLLASPNQIESKKQKITDSSGPTPLHHLLLKPIGKSPGPWTFFFFFFRSATNRFIKRNRRKEAYHIQVSQRNVWKPLTMIHVLRRFITPNRGHFISTNIISSLFFLFKSLLKFPYFLYWFNFWNCVISDHQYVLGQILWCVFASMYASAANQCRVSVLVLLSNFQYLFRMILTWFSTLIDWSATSISEDYSFHNQD